MTEPVGTALVGSQGNLGAVEQTPLVRGLTALAAHLSWTGLTAGAGRRGPRPTHSVEAESSN
ncbi:hypothetical protein ACH495_12260 [Micromonospora sp. NPDC018662]|uniref:hypothetical protein n=1 Tax=Micromonospora sp. NPDC018662 TaxID=3364238 RepID=UPI0037A27C69